MVVLVEVRYRAIDRGPDYRAQTEPNAHGETRSGSARGRPAPLRGRRLVWQAVQLGDTAGVGMVLLKRAADPVVADALSETLGLVPEYA